MLLVRKGGSIGPMHPVVVRNTRDGVTVRSAGKEDTQPIDEAFKVASSGDDILLLAD